METIIVTNFAVESQAYQAFSEIKNSRSNALSLISQAALVVKVDEHVKILESFNDSSNDETIVGGIVGGLIGVLAGPIGLIFGSAIGVLAGAAIDDNADDKESLLIEQVMQDITSADGVTLVAFAQEEDGQLYDSIMAKFDTATTRYDAAEVADELSLAHKMEADLKKQASLELRKEKRQNRQKRHQDRKEEMKRYFDALKSNSKH
ncbi:hypothetical protein [Streptococcus sp. zg-JUN1979]|uniref:hypothetical protein n=1 Tax=Streptococcus sp. zg-JUN1979 TaxID=3391450 RepID=UPI0039A51AD4